MDEDYAQERNELRAEMRGYKEVALREGAKVAVVNRLTQQAEDRFPYENTQVYLGDLFLYGDGHFEDYSGVTPLEAVVVAVLQVVERRSYVLTLQVTNVRDEHKYAGVDEKVFKVLYQTEYPRMVTLLDNVVTQTISFDTPGHDRRWLGNQVPFTTNKRDWHTADRRESSLPERLG
jgi:hypothetical protein